MRKTPCIGRHRCSQTMKMLTRVRHTKISTNDSPSLTSMRALFWASHMQGVYKNNILIQYDQKLNAVLLLCFGDYSNGRLLVALGGSRLYQVNQLIENEFIMHSSKQGKPLKMPYSINTSVHKAWTISENILRSMQHHMFIMRLFKPRRPLKAPYNFNTFVHLNIPETISTH